MVDPRQLGIPVVVASHRAPVQFRREAGRRHARRGAGGLVTALVGLMSQLDDAVWVCAASTEEDVAVANEHKGRPMAVVMKNDPEVVDDSAAGAGSAASTVSPGRAGAPVLNIRMVELDPAAHDDFYGVISNPLLWFIQHGLYDLTRSPNFGTRERDAFEHGYVSVNHAFADAVSHEVEACGGRALVMLHDYHFYLVADLVRQRCPDVVLSHFVHIPWPGPDAWRVLPPDMRERVMRGLLGNDVVAFHTERFARNFLLCAQELLGLSINLDKMTVQVGPRTVTAKTYPISIDVEALLETANSKVVRGRLDDVEQWMVAEGGQLIVRVDRTDPSKNIVRGFLAFERLLDDHPELVGKVRFFAFLQPSRLDVPEYAEYVGRIGAVVARVNAKYTRSGDAPIDLRLHEDFATAVAAYAICDVVMVNSIADGMNLVAKEAVSVSRRNAVLALSESTGAHEELGAFAVTLYPFDVQQQADALYEALTMPPGRRRDLREAAAQIVHANDVGKWLDFQLADLAEITGLWYSP
ncbi:MAG: alpha,alpha-trehalose-phosphate synthase (UDP-forming) [Acidothermaceae bacterium]